MPIAESAGISKASVGRIWRAHGLQPHIVRGFKLSTDPQFIEKVRDIVGLHMNPPVTAVVLSFDEKPQVQALERGQPVLPWTLGCRSGKLTTTSDTGPWISLHRAKDFTAFLKLIDDAVEEEVEAHNERGRPFI